MTIQVVSIRLNHIRLYDKIWLYDNIKKSYTVSTSKLNSYIK